MVYQAVRDRCAFNFDESRLAISLEETLRILTSKGFTVIDVDIVELAQTCIGVAKYRRGARLFEAPAVFDCSSFIKWLYAQRGIWLPRRSIQQYEFGEKVQLDGIVAGDVVFTSGHINYFLNNPEHGIGHVGLYTGYGTIVHAANAKNNIVESPLYQFIGNNEFRGVRRYVPKEVEILTLKTPLNREVETADDICWIVLQSLKD